MGSSFEDTSIDCEHFYNIKFDNKDTEKPIGIKKTVLFTLFIFFDFSIRVLRKTELFNNSYYQLAYNQIAIDTVYLFYTKKNNSSLTEQIEYKYSSNPGFYEFSFLFHLLNTFKEDEFHKIETCNYILALFSYKKTSKRELVDFYESKKTINLIKIIFKEYLYNKNYSKEFIYVNNLLSPIINKWNDLVIKQFSHTFNDIYTPLNIIRNYLSNIKEFNELQDVPINQLRNKFLKDNEDNGVINCILEIDNKRLWGSSQVEILAVKKKIENKIFENLKQINNVKIKEFDTHYYKYTELFSEIQPQNPIYVDLNQIEYTIDYNKGDILKLQDYMTLLYVFYLILHKSKYNSTNIIKEIKFLTTAKILIDEKKEEEFNFWMYTYLRSNIHKIDDHDIYKEECIADLIDELYDFFEKNDIYDNSKKEEKLLPETIKTINEWSTLKDADEEKPETSPEENITTQKKTTGKGKRNNKTATTKSNLENLKTNPNKSKKSGE